MLYMDMSIFVATLINGADTTRIQVWLSAQDKDALAISPWVVTELSSALAMKIRTKEITAAYRADALRAFATMKAAKFKLLEVGNSHFDAAAQFTDTLHGLRAGDALHLAIVSKAGATLCTLDKKFVDCCASSSVKVKLI